MREGKNEGRGGRDEGGRGGREIGRETGRKGDREEERQGGRETGRRETGRRETGREGRGRVRGARGSRGREGGEGVLSHRHCALWWALLVVVVVCGRCRHPRSLSSSVWFHLLAVWQVSGSSVST